MMSNGSKETDEFVAIRKHVSDNNKVSWLGLGSKYINFVGSQLSNHLILHYINLFLHRIIMSFLLVVMMNKNLSFTILPFLVLKMVVKVGEEVVFV